ncbi:hypothetical protein GCM10010381_37420 [Streptomyces xantholiticus]|nr:hypothetical protein GCM10010381_37420 [Streptomyces xantholiticus]
MVHEGHALGLATIPVGAVPGVHAKRAVRVVRVVGVICAIRAAYAVRTIVVLRGPMHEGAV